MSKNDEFLNLFFSYLKKVLGDKYSGIYTQMLDQLKIDDLTQDPNVDPEVLKDVIETLEYLIQEQKSQA